MIYRELIEKLRALGGLKEFVQPVPKDTGDTQRVCLHYYALDPIEKFAQLARDYPDHRDEVMHIAAATESGGWLLLRTAARVYGVNAGEALFEPLVRAYTSAPQDLAEYQMSVPKFTRNMITAMHHALGGRSGTPSLFEPLVNDPPPAVRTQEYYRLLHTLFTQTIAHRYHPDPLRIRTMADAIQAWDYFVEHDDVTELLYLAPKDAALIPLVNRLVAASPRGWQRPAAQFYLSSFARTPDAWEPNDAEAGWTKANLYAPLREPLDELFAQRAFTDDAVDAVFQSLVEGATDETISAWFAAALNDLYTTSGLSRNLIRGLAVRMPDKVKHYVELAMQSVTPNTQGWEKIADWIAGEHTDDDRKVVDLIPQDVRRATQWALAERFDQFGGQRDWWVGNVARRLLTAALGIHPDTTRIMSADEAIRYWQQVRLFFTDPQRLLSDEQIAPATQTQAELTGAKPLTMGDYWREFDTARREFLHKLLCQGG